MVVFSRIYYNVWIVFLLDLYQVVRFLFFFNENFLPKSCLVVKLFVPLHPLSLIFWV